MNPIILSHLALILELKLKQDKIKSKLRSE